MANSPVSLILPQYDIDDAPAAGYYLKGYQAGTTTPITMYTDAAGSSSLAKAALDANGFPVTSGNVKFTPHFAEDFDLWLFPDSTSADANDTSSATQITDSGILINGFFQAETGATSRLISDKLKDLPVSTLDFGGAADGATNDAAALILALNTGKLVDVPENSVFTLTAAQALTFIDNINLVQPREITTFNLPAAEISVSDFVDWSNPFARNVILKGYETTPVTVSAVSQSGSAKNHSVIYTVSSAAEIEVDDYLLIAGSSGTGDFKVIEGCFKVTNVSGTDITVKHTLNDTWPTLTVSSANCYIIKTILRWPADTRGLSIYACSPREIKNVVLAGQFNITSESPGDGYTIGLHVGTEPNFDETGLTESEQTNTGSAWLQRCGIVEWENNGVRVVGGNLYGFITSFCSNGWRGCQAARTGTALVKFSSAVGNGASGYQAEGVSFVNASSSVASGNTQQGFYSIGPSTVLALSSYSLNNVTNGIDARNGGTVYADGATVENNKGYGVQSICGLVVFGTSATSANNDIYDVFVSEAGIVNGNGASSLGTVNRVEEQGTVIIDADGDLIYENISVLENADGDQFKFTISSLADLILSVDTGGGFSNVVVIRSTGNVYPSSDNSQDFGRQSERWKSGYIRQLLPGDGTPIWTSGSGTPEGSVTAVVGSLFTRTDGGANTTLYVKESGSGNTGWVAK